MLVRSGVPGSLINAQDWEKYKFHIISPIIDHLNSNGPGLGPLRRVLQETLAFSKCDHLLWLPDGKDKKREAEESIGRLRDLVREHDVETKTKEEQRQARVKRQEEARRGRAFEGKRTEIKTRFMAYLQDPDRQQRGYGLEDILYDLFVLFELDPKAPFRRTGEQIDGAFSLDRDHFLLEAKWQAKPADLNALRDLDGAVASSLDNTLGLFISINGFSPEGLDGYAQGNRPKLICMDGGDLMAVLEGLVDLRDLLIRKKDVASQRRTVFVRAQEIMSGKF